MGISYRKLFRLMESKGIKKIDLRKSGLSPTIVDRLIKNKNVNTSTIIELCKMLECQPADIMEYVVDNTTIQSNEISEMTEEIVDTDCSFITTKERALSIFNQFTEEQFAAFIMLFDTEECL